MNKSSLRHRQFPNGDIIRLLELKTIIDYNQCRIITIRLEILATGEVHDLVRYLSNPIADQHSFELPIYRSVYEYLKVTEHFGFENDTPKLSLELKIALKFLSSGYLYHIAREESVVRYYFKQRFKEDHPFDLDIRPALNGSSSIVLKVDTADENYHIYTQPEETSIELPMDLMWGKIDCEELRKAIRQMPNVVVNAQSIYKHLTRHIL